MITRRTKLQLLVFAIITLLGVSFVGARYAQLDRLVVDRSYNVTVDLADSGGSFTGSLVAYRGVKIGQVGELTLTERGVEAELVIEDTYDDIPADTTAVVGNRSALGEQYIELQPQTDEEPFLADGDVIPEERTSTPLPVETLLSNVSTTVGSVDDDDLRTVVSELGDAFAGTGPDLQQIIDTGNSFIETADDNFATTANLIENANTVLSTQLDNQENIRSFATDLSLFSGTLAGADDDLRRVIDTGGATANQLRTFLEDNDVALGRLLDNLVTTGEIVVRRLPNIQQFLVLYPYVVSGSFTVVTQDPRDGLKDAHFGLVLTSEPQFCTQGYKLADRPITSPFPPTERQRDPQTERGDIPMEQDARCTLSPEQGNVRGQQNNPPRIVPWDSRPTVASYDRDSGRVRWGSQVGEEPTSSRAPEALGDNAWSWLLMHPLTSTE
ncbi:MlaD family protein [uncultured Nocardioides sp.]|uniref:MCE family protein n=1 Tax=uncultured Nocardioides sp. TaxID=198441 RepID=UPI0026072493|nr:MlaD family protein [uncultured Nocardioides sp.]